MKKEKLNCHIKNFIAAVDNYEIAYNELCNNVESLAYEVHSDVFEFSSKDVEDLHKIILEKYNEIVEKSRYYNGTKTGRLDLIMSLFIDECLYKISYKKDIEKEIEGLALDFYG